MPDRHCEQSEAIQTRRSWRPLVLVASRGSRWLAATSTRLPRRQPSLDREGANARSIRWPARAARSGCTSAGPSAEISRQPGSESAIAERTARNSSESRNTEPKAWQRPRQSISSMTVLRSNGSQRNDTSDSCGNRPTSPRGSAASRSRPISSRRFSAPPRSRTAGGGGAGVASTGGAGRRHRRCRRRRPQPATRRGRYAAHRWRVQAGRARALYRRARARQARDQRLALARADRRRGVRTRSARHQPPQRGRKAEIGLGRGAGEAAGGRLPRRESRQRFCLFDRGSNRIDDRNRNLAAHTGCEPG